MDHKELALSILLASSSSVSIAGSDLENSIVIAWRDGDFLESVDTETQARISLNPAGSIQIASLDESIQLYTEDPCSGTFAPCSFAPCSFAPCTFVPCS